MFTHLRPVEKFNPPADHQFADPILRVGLAGDNKLHRMLLISQDLEQTVLVIEQQGRPFVISKSPGKADG